MGSILLNPKDKKEFKFISNLLSKLGIDAKVLSDEELEDLGMSKMMKGMDQSDLVSKEEIIKKLSA